MRHFTVLLLMLTIAVLVGCSDHNPARSVSTPAPYFPNQVGSYWVYQVYDSVRANTDTVTLTIADTATLPGTSAVATLWTYDTRDQWIGIIMDSSYIVADGSSKSTSDRDTVGIYRWPQGHDPWLTGMYVLPLEVNSYWTNHDLGLMWDSTHVHELTKVSTPAGDFSKTYRLVQEYSCGDECGGWNTYWFKPGVGIVSSKRVEWDIFDDPYAPQLVTTWELIDYHIAQESRPGHHYYD